MGSLMHKVEVGEYILGFRRMTFTGARDTMHHRHRQISGASYSWFAVVKVI